MAPAFTLLLRLKHFPSPRTRRWGKNVERCRNTTVVQLEIKAATIKLCRAVEHPPAWLEEGILKPGGTAVMSRLGGPMG